MKIIRIYDKLNTKITLALGFFDAVHRGHRELIAKAKSIGDTLAVLTFTDSGVGKLKGVDGLVCTYEERIHMLEEQGVDVVVLAPSDDEFLSKSREDFLNLLKSNFVIQTIVVGEDYHFGKDKGGDVEYLKKFASIHNFKLLIMSTVMYGGVKLSTSVIRKCITNGDISTANQMLGYPYSITNKVAKGRSKGRAIGFPTLNINIPSDNVVPQAGVYATNCIIGSVSYPSITNVGTHPTFFDENFNVETHIINAIIGDDIFEITLQFLNKMRDVKHFLSESDLIEQLKLDKEERIKVDD